jgi:Outer membrane protein beta-barrel domain
MFTRRLSALLVLVLGLSCLSPVAWADGAFLFKLGNLQLRDTTQTLDIDHEFERNSASAYGAMVEHRFRRSGIGIGAEYALYRHEYTPPGDPKGMAETRALMFSARKYFLYDKPVRPFIGFGLGIGRTRIDNAGPTPYNDKEFTTVFQGTAGVEFRIENLSIMVEVRHLQHDIEGGGNEYDPTATGLFAGFGLNW